jgi:hypothetical protein
MANKCDRNQQDNTGLKRVIEKKDERPKGKGESVKSFGVATVCFLARNLSSAE